MPGYAAIGHATQSCQGPWRERLPAALGSNVHPRFPSDGGDLVDEGPEPLLVVSEVFAGRGPHGRVERAGVFVRERDRL